jgi:hypothetical protein
MCSPYKPKCDVLHISETVTGAGLLCWTLSVHLPALKLGDFHTQKKSEFPVSLEKSGLATLSPLLSAIIDRQGTVQCCPLWVIALLVASPVHLL